MYFYTRLMLALDFVIPISSTSLPGGNLVDGLPPAASEFKYLSDTDWFPGILISKIIRVCKIRV